MDARTKEAHEIHELDGVSYGCHVLRDSDTILDLSDERDQRLFRCYATPRLLDMKMANLRNLAKFWGVNITKAERSKIPLAVKICEVYCDSVHPTHRPRSNYAIVTRDCPARFYR